MRKIFLTSFIVASVSFFASLIQPNNISARVCTSVNGNSGTCRVTCDTDETAEDDDGDCARDNAICCTPKFPSCDSGGGTCRFGEYPCRTGEEVRNDLFCQSNLNAVNCCKPSFLSCESDLMGQCKASGIQTCGNSVYAGKLDCTTGLNNICCANLLPPGVGDLGDNNPTTPGNAGQTIENCGTISDPGFPSAIGCIPYQDSEEFVGFFLKWGIGIGGGIAFLLIVVSGFQIMTASGNPEQIKKGQDTLKAAIAGLILLIFSVFVLRVIGVDILKIPGIT